MRRLLPFVLMAVLLFSPSAFAAPVTAPQCFQVPGIADCIDGQFKDYWNANGSLPVFGYPTTPERPEVNRDTQQTYQTQWFERNRFEAHPENKAPYHVLLGRLGAELLAKNGRGFEGIPAGQTPAGTCQTFDVGGQQQAVCGAFLTYWRAHGLEFDGQRGTSYGESLALFGLPLTYPKMETNPNGDTVLTQWFERARFEDHGTNGVLLGLLGREAAGPTPPPPPPLTPTPGPSLPPPSYNNCQSDPNADRAVNAPIKIVNVRKADNPEVVVLQNVSGSAVNLDGWIMCSIAGNQRHEGIGGVLEPGQTREFAYTGSGTIWNNSNRDDGALYNPQGQLVSYWFNQ